MGAEESHPVEKSPPMLPSSPLDHRGGATPDHQQPQGAVATEARAETTKSSAPESLLDPKSEEALSGTPSIIEPAPTRPQHNPQSKPQYESVSPGIVIDQLDGAVSVPNRGPSLESDGTSVQDLSDGSQTLQILAIGRSRSDAEANTVVELKEGSQLLYSAEETADGLPQDQFQMSSSDSAGSEVNAAVNQAFQDHERQNDTTQAHSAITDGTSPSASVEVPYGNAVWNKHAGTKVPIGLTAQHLSQLNAQKPTQQTLMPPPTAPASMLWNLKPSTRARWPNEQHHDPAICRRLIAVAVILFRQGKAKDATALGQYTIDLIGEKIWSEELPVYMAAPPLPDDNEAVIPLLEQTAEIIRVDDPASSAFLDGMLYMMN